MNIGERITSVESRAPHLTIDRRGVTKMLSVAIFVLASLMGVLAFVSPFFTPFRQSAPAMNPALFLGALVMLCVAAMIVEAQGQVMSAKLIALLGALVAINSALRFAENALPGPAGFTPVFMLIILAGYVFGARFGFLMGALTMLVSAMITAGIGPWLPYQMFTAGWMGLSAGILDFRWPVAHSSQSQIGHRQSGSAFARLLVFAGVWGFLYGAIMNLWSWPFQAGDPAQSWQAGFSFDDGLKRYAVFYVDT
jgi:energy-coupling factor transport system substrate-specific component